MGNQISEIDRDILDDLIEKYPGYAIVISQRFLGGYEENEFGSVPLNWNGLTMKFIPATDWWGWKFRR